MLTIPYSRKTLANGVTVTRSYIVRWLPAGRQVKIFFYVARHYGIRSAFAAARSPYFGW